MLALIDRTQSVRPVCQRSRGFSVVEVLGALVLSLILATVAMVSLRLYQKDLPLNGTANRLAHLMATARAMAISRNGTFAVIIDRTYNNFWVDEIDSAGNKLVPKVISPESIGELVVVDSILPGSGQPAVARFNPDGSSDDLYIHLKLKSRQQSTDERDVTTVRLYGPTGQSRVFQQRRLTP